MQHREAFLGGSTYTAWRRVEGMRQLSRAGILLALLLTSSAPGAEPGTSEVLTGNSLAKKCNGNDKMNVVFCLGYLVGTSSTVVALQSLDALKEEYCPPVDLKPSQLAYSFFKYVHAHPEEGDNLAPMRHS